MSVAKLEARNRSHTPTSEMEQLVSVLQNLCSARSLDSLTAVVRTAVRTLLHADGATFVVREGEFCYYLDEDAISPLWKGKRFPMKSCISGWVMLHKQAAFIEDIYADVRIPMDAYRPTFVRSLAMVPIRLRAPLGAIGAYWAKHHRTTKSEIKLLQAIAEGAAAAWENIRCQAELESRVAERTTELEKSNKGLEAFADAVAHDLKAPLRSVRGFVEALQEECSEDISDAGKDYLLRITRSANRMSDLIDDLFKLSQTSRAPFQRTTVDISAIANEVAEELRASAPERNVTFSIAMGLQGSGDAHLLQTVMENLLRNAWKFSSRKNGSLDRSRLNPD